MVNLSFRLRTKLLWDDWSQIQESFRSAPPSRSVLFTLSASIFMLVICTKVALAQSSLYRNLTELKWQKTTLAIKVCFFAMLVNREEGIVLKALEEEEQVISLFVSKLLMQLRHVKLHSNTFTIQKVQPRDWLGALRILEIASEKGEVTL